MGKEDRRDGQSLIMSSRFVRSLNYEDEYFVCMSDNCVSELNLKVINVWVSIGCLKPPKHPRSFYSFIAFMSRINDQHLTSNR